MGPADSDLPGGDRTGLARQRLLLASNNPGKWREMVGLLRGLPVEVVTPATLGFQVVVEENGVTYAENAILKARAFARASGLISLADDSGLEVDALGGEPGVLTARMAGPNADDAERRRVLLDRLAVFARPEQRLARFISVVAVATPAGMVHQAEGIITGRLATEERGIRGFGFDPLFIPQGYEQTFAELPLSVKNHLSHRARAIRALRPVLRALLQPGPIDQSGSQR